MSCCSNCSTRIINLGAGAPFTFNVTSGSGPLPGGPILTGPITITNNDTIHFWSTNTIDFDVTLGSANVETEVRLDPNPTNALTSSVAGLFVPPAAYSWNVNGNSGANFNVSNTESVKFTSGNGSINVNLSDPNVELNVVIDPNPLNAYIRFMDSAVLNGSITPGGGSTVLYNTTSDRNLKENIRDTELEATNLIENIDIVEYNFIADENKTNLHGLIAQDLYNIYPEAVSKGSEETPWGIDYSKLVPVLLKSIQELSNRVKELENQVKS